ncbi:hypothetical protein [Methylibium sp.]|uniref:hypothetical protein n=1 Tax=Methylibium sp. TaxID=2067992 RepID=UPI003D0F918D
MSHTVRVGNGRLVVPLETYECYLGAATSAALLERDGRVLLLPLSGPVAGGLLLKQRNLHGDRVLLAPEFLARCGHGELGTDREYAVRWASEDGALWIEGLSAAG